MFSIMLETQYQLAALVQLAGTCGSGSTVPAAKTKMPTFLENFWKHRTCLSHGRNPDQSGRTISLTATTSLSKLHIKIADGANSN